MRHNQNGRRFRGRNNNQGGNGGGGGNHHHSNHSNGGGNRRVNPRVQTFDSNGPEVRIRGNAYQINEKYLTLAKDASSAGDRILAESYLQHAEHYQRMINEMTEEYNRQNPQNQIQAPVAGEHDQPSVDAGEGEQPVVHGAAMPDLDQGFLVGRRQASPSVPTGEEEQPKIEPREPREPRAPRQPKAAADNA